MKTLAVFEVDAIMNSARVAALAKLALREPEHVPYVITYHGPSETETIVGWLDERLRASKWPKSMPVLALGTQQAKAQRFASLLVQGQYDKVIVFETDATTAATYANILRGRLVPSRWTVYLVDGTALRVHDSTAEFSK